MSDIAIRVEDLSKQYRIGSPSTGLRTGSQARYKTIRESLIETVQVPFRRAARLLRGQALRLRSGQAYSAAEMDETIWALKDVSFEVKRGEVVGIIGRNGAGKTTLLKVLSRITEPTEGYAEIHGRVGSLLEVGTGFHPELTGRENIYLNGAILGMKRAEIELKFDEIVAFAEIEKFLDTPVKHYSSGMYVRLAFAVAAHLEPEILLVDEVLAVGDAAFQKKCLGKMGDVAKEGRTVLFVSHNMAAISALCNKAMMIDRGKVHKYGLVEETIALYAASLRNLTAIPLRERKDRGGNGKLRFLALRCVDHKGREVPGLRTGEDAHIEVSFRKNLADQDMSEVTLSLAFVSRHGQPLILCRNDYTGDEFGTMPQNGSAICMIPNFPLMPGVYEVNLYAERKGEVLDWVQSAVQIEVLEGDFFGTGRLPPRSYGTVLVKHRWFLA
jgi:lipopolysaccharide transport system ATP-binding protein